MPSPALVAPTQPAQDRRQGGNAPVLRPLPFVRAADEHVEPILDMNVQMDANPHGVAGVVDIPSFGFLRSLLVQVNATGGVGGAANVAALEDAPWSVISEIAVQDIAGSYIFGPLSGHDLYLAAKYGGTSGFFSDPASLPSFVAPAAGAGASGNFSFMIRIPLEISLRDALGALPNQNSASTYKMRLTMANTAAVYATAPATTLPLVRFRVSAEEWTPPDSVDLAGRPQETVPPDMGTTMFWTKSPRNINAGMQTVRLDRTGNLVRLLVLVFRNATPVRDLASMPDPLQLTWDNHNIFNAYRDILRAYMYERYGYTNLDTGVLVLDFIHEMMGKAGNELRDLWMPTTGASRIDLVGTFAVAGTLSILTCDVQPVGDVYAGEGVGR